MAGTAPSPGSSRKSPDGQIPSASSGEIGLKRLPSPAPGGLNVSKLAKSIIRPISGAAAMASTTIATPAGRADLLASVMATERDRRRTLTPSSTTAHRPAAPASHNRPGKL